MCRAGSRWRYSAAGEGCFPLINNLRGRLRAEWMLYGILILWVLAMISIPIQRWASGDESLKFAITLGTALQAAAGLLILIYSFETRKALIIAGVVVVAAWLVEYIGSHTGFPFGAYHYTSALQPQLGGVPILIPLAWLMMLPVSWGISSVLVGNRGKLIFLIVNALIFTAWDLFLDPQMVGWGFWVWHDPPAFNYFGIPLTNYLGWLLASMAITAAAMLAGMRPEKIPALPSLVIYTVTWFLEAFGLLLFWGLPGPALIGTVAMGLPIVLTARKLYLSN